MFYSYFLIVVNAGQSHSLVQGTSLWIFFVLENFLKFFRVLFTVWLLIVFLLKVLIADVESVYIVIGLFTVFLSFRILAAL